MIDVARPPPTKRVGVVIVNYNSAGELSRCLGSLAEEPDLVTVVVDNSPSPFEAKEVVEQYRGVTLLDAGGNVGFGKGCNCGLEWLLLNTGVDYFFLLNPDTVLGPGSIEVMLSEMESDSSIGMVVPLITFLDSPDVIWYAGGDVSWLRASARVPLYGRSSSLPEACAARDVTFASGCAMFMRRNVYQTIGGFDRRYFMYEEDVEYSLRIVEAGFRIRYCPDARVLHRTQGTQRAEGMAVIDMYDIRNPRLPFYMYHVTRGRLLTVGRHGTSLQHMPAVAVFLAWWLMRCLKYLIRGRADAFRAAVSGALSVWRAGRQTVS